MVYVPTRELSTVSLELCAAVHKSVAVEIRATKSTPYYMWLRRARGRPNHGWVRGDSRVQGYELIRSILWEMLSVKLISERSELFERNATTTLVDKEKGEKLYIWWPASLQKLTFGLEFNRHINDVVWPRSLQQLVFGEMFDHLIDSVTRPKFLQNLKFGGNSIDPSKMKRGRTVCVSLY